MNMITLISVVLTVKTDAYSTCTDSSLKGKCVGNIVLVSGVTIKVFQSRQDGFIASLIAANNAIQTTHTTMMAMTELSGKLIVGLNLHTLP